MHLKDWQRKFTPITIDMANNLLGDIKNYKEEENKVSGTVDGFNASFSININREVTDLECDCDFAKSGNLCKHMCALILSYEKKNDDSSFETKVEPYPLDLVWLEKHNLISDMTKEFLADRNMISLPSYRFFDVKINGESYLEVVCDKYKEGKGRLFEVK